jgi:hypothetical protein
MTKQALVITLAAVASLRLLTLIMAIRSAMMATALHRERTDRRPPARFNRHQGIERGSHREHDTGRLSRLSPSQQFEGRQ